MNNRAPGKRIMWRFVAAGGIILMLCLLAWGIRFRAPSELARAQVIGMQNPPSSAEYMRVEGPRALIFPRDNGPHPEFQTEWWYYTGNLEAQGGRRFGFQLTFFRRAITPQQDQPARASSWATSQVYLAHFTLTDVSNGKFYAFERFERGAAGLAGAQGEPAFQVWLHDWSVEQVGNNRYHLNAREGQLAIDLQLVDRKGPVLQGDRGYSQKGPEPGNASLYYSQTHLESSGTITIGGQAYPVTGLSWMDREISTSALSAGQVGWDWFALHMDDGSELMVYALRREDGSMDAFSSGLFIDADGATRRIAKEDFQIQVEDTWQSPHSKGIYPSRWQVRVPSIGMVLQVTPQVADQELNVSVIYWEGAVQVRGSRNGKPLSGYGYVELTGYARSLEGQF